MGTGLDKAALKGAHLRLPGYEKEGPTLLIIQFEIMKKKAAASANRIGWNALSFEVEDIQKTTDKALKFGAKMQGEMSRHYIEDLGLLHFVYLQDPEGNLIELQQIEATATNPDKTESVKTSKENPAKLSEAAKRLAKKTKKPVSKRELLEELHNDLDESSKALKEAKDTIKASKETLNKKNTLQEPPLSTKEKAYLDDFLAGKKTKATLLKELKEEMEQDKSTTVEGAETNTPSIKKIIKTNTAKTKAPLQGLKKAAKQPASLTVEIKKGAQVSTLDLSSLKLDLAPDILAANLRAINTLARPDDYQYLFIEWVGKIYKADLVPLVKFFDPDKNKASQEAAWAIKDRLRDSLRHLLGRCSTDRTLLEDLHLNSIDKNIDDFILSYKSYLTIVEMAEKKGAEFIRISYSPHR